MKKTYTSLSDLLTDLSPYLNQSALARICGVNEGQMRQYASGVRNPSPKTLAKIIANLNAFGRKLADIGMGI